MNKTTVLCAVLAGTFGFSTLASAQDWRGGRDRDGDQRTEQRRDRGDRNDRHDRRDNDRNWRQDRHDNRSWNDHQRYQQRGYVQSQPRGYVYSQPNYVYTQPSYGYSAPNYYAHTQRYHRGGYLPRQYLSNQYYVNNWQSYPGLYAPPYGHQWVNTGGEFLLVALATGLIANALMN